MRKLIVLLVQIQLSVLLAFGQQQDEKPTIESVEITGIDQSRIRQDLKDLMQELVGMKFDQQSVDEVAFQIQNSLHERVFAIRQSPGTDPEKIKLVFELNASRIIRRGPIRIRIEDDIADPNEKYVVEDVEFRGITEASISTQIREEIKKLIGQKLDNDRTREIQDRIAQQLGRGRIVSRRVSRGSMRDQIRIIFEIRRQPLFDYLQLGKYLVGQQKQSLSFGVEDGWDGRINRFAVGFFNDGDKLLERYAGYTLTFENRKAGTEHVGFRIHYFNYHDKWKRATEDAVRLNPEIPGIYRERRGIEPSVTFAVDRRLRFIVGASISEMQIQYPAEHFMNANAATFGVKYEGAWRDDEDNRHRFSGDYLARSATHQLGSDFIYTRHAGEFRYSLRHGDSEFVADLRGGLINGRAPLFERFTLGNTSTLRGWNKYDLNPLGGNRMAHASFEYRYNNIAVFYDTGAVWEAKQTHQLSHSVGFGVHSREADHRWFVTGGVPIENGRIKPLKPVFMAGIRF